MPLCLKRVCFEDHSSLQPGRAAAAAAKASRGPDQFSILESSYIMSIQTRVLEHASEENQQPRTAPPKVRTVYCSVGRTEHAD